MPSSSKKREKAPAPASKSWVAGLLGFGVAAAGGVALFAMTPAAGCSSSEPEKSGPSGRESMVEAQPNSENGHAAPAPGGDAPTSKTVAVLGGAPGAPSGAPGDPATEPSAPAGPPPDETWTGPMLGAMALQTPIYADTRFTKERLGYIRKGGRAPAEEKAIEKSNCKQGWYKLIAGGYVCGKYATLDPDDPKVKLGVTAPDLKAVLPYRYAYNRKHGTPLYKVMPSRADMLRYEPYLEEKKPKPEEGAPATPDPATPDPADVATADGSGTEPGPIPDTSASNPAGDPDAGVATAPPIEELSPEPGPPPSWWEEAENTGEKPQVTLTELEKEADGNLAKRMVKGFFIAVDKSFSYQGRLWYRTTNGLVAPADRMYLQGSPESKGMPFPAGAKQIGFMLSDKGGKFEITSGKVKRKGDVKRLTPFALTGDVETIDDKTYRKTVDGWWMRSDQGTFTAPDARPSEVGPTEKWIDVNLETNTLVALVGDEAVYAALVSPGKKSRNRKKNHATKIGSFRIREKHIAVTMDGDGAGGDLPYSIEDVPFVQYYDGSFALHAAFWHKNFGRQMSHGCVNLSPLDAKELFLWTEPRIPRGWHAVWATEQNKGTLVVIHE